MSYDGRSGYDREVASTYDADRENEDHWQAENDFVRQYASANSIGRVLDIPVGTARLARFLDDAAIVIGIDVSPDMLTEAMSLAVREAKSLRLVMADGLFIPLRNAAVDTVLCFRLVHLMPPAVVDLLLSELARVCAGRVLLQVYVYPPTAKGQRLRSRVRSRVQRILGARTRTTPWSHIGSYAHSAEFFDSAILGAGLVVKERHGLGTYGAASVEVLELCSA